MFANCILFATFCSMGTPVRRKKTWRYSAWKVMEFGQLMADIRYYVSCKFEMYIFKIAKVIGENVPIAFLYVLSICTCIYMHACRVHACVMPYFGLACNIFIVFTVVS